MSNVLRVRSLTVTRSISEGDRMYNAIADRHYFYVGQSNLLTILNILDAKCNYIDGEAPPKDILDFGCGHGRVTRWLRSGFRDSNIFVTDYDATGVQWCVSELGCVEAQLPLVPASYDLIWLGSVFTHLPQITVRSLIKDLVGALRPNGVLAFTSQGRFAVRRMEGFSWMHDKRSWMHYGLQRDKFERIVSEYHSSGYGFEEYDGQSGYGVCIAKPSWYSDKLHADDGVTQIFFQEKGSDNHQDVSAFMRADIRDDRKGGLW